MTLIALDLDGTLEDSRADMVAAICRVRAGFGLPPRPEAALRPWVSKGMPALYRNTFDDLGLADDPGRYAEAKAAYEADYLAHVAVDTRLYPGIPEALAELEALGRLAVVTNKPEHISRALLEALGIGHHFAAVIGGDTCAEPKPSPLMLAEAVRQTGATGRVFMCGDSNGDMKLARAAGATSVWCRWGYYDALVEPFDLAATSPADLPGLVR